jgi:hypothetical protein
MVVLKLTVQTRRPRMAKLSKSLEQIKARLEEFVPERQILGICIALKYRWRRRVLGPTLTIHLFLLQLLAKVALRGVRHVAQVSVTAQAICQAKKRLPLKLLMELVGFSAPPGETLPRWHGLIAHLVDGTSSMTPDTPELARRYGKGKNQRGTSFGYPLPKLLALMDLGGGFVRKVIALPWARQEFTCLSRLFKLIDPRGLLLGDRGLVSFTHLAMLCNAGLHGCFRLPHGMVTFGRGKGSRKRIKRLGKQDMLVRWIASRRPTWVSVKRWAPLATQQLVLRQIAYRVCRPGFRTQWAWIITTLTDPKEYPAQELIDLYSKRWQIEVYFRDLKKTLGMEMISARSIDGVRKEILAFVLLYNLVRRVMVQAALQQNVAADRISFVDALRWLLWSAPGEPIPRLEINPQRKRRSPPRKIKRGRHRFPQIKGLSAELSKPACVAML